MTLATISYGPKLGLLNNAAINSVFYDQFRPFLRGMDTLIQANVLARSATPPPSPNDGDAYIVLMGATGAWTGETNNIAVYSSQITAAGSNNLTPGWEFHVPQPGWIVYSIADHLFYYMNVSGSWVSSLATTSVAGSVVPDGTTITVTNSGVISATASPIATTSVAGIVKPDGSTVTINGSGVISAASTSIATTSTAGLVKPDGTTIDVNGSGVIRVPTATTGALGLVKPDGSTIVISSGVISAVGGGSGSGIVSAALTVPSEFSISGSPITGAGGTIVITKANQNANFVYVGPSSGSAVAPTFRALVPADLPVATTSALGAIKPDGSTITINAGVISAAATSIATTSVAGIVKPDGTTISVNGSGVIGVPTATSSVLGLVKPDGSTITNSLGAISVPTATTSVLGLVKPDGTSVTISSGTISATASVPSGTANKVFATPNGSSGSASLRALVAADLPAATTSVLGAVKPDGTTITISGGAISAVPTSLPSGSANTVVATPNGSSGVASLRALVPADLPTATTVALGAVRPDNSTITISSGVLTATAAAPATATTSTLGIVKPDNLTLTINSGVLSVIGLGPNAGWGAQPGTGSAGSYFVQALGAMSVFQSPVHSLTFSAPVTAGNTLIVMVMGNAPSGVSDSLGNLFTLIPYGGANLYYYISNHITTGGTDTITVAPSSINDSFVILEYTGLPTGSGASTVIAGVGVSLNTLGPTTLTSQSLVMLFQYCDSSTFSATGATQRFLTSSDGVGNRVGVGDMVVNAGSFSITIGSGGIAYGFVAIRTT